VFFELQSCVIAASEGELNNISKSWLINGTVNVAIMSDLQKNKNSDKTIIDGNPNSNEEDDSNEKHEEQEKT